MNFLLTHWFDNDIIKSVQNIELKMQKGEKLEWLLITVS
nr:MAG TPA: hypothetical protein [Bacteriophage sp.]